MESTFATMARNLAPVTTAREDEEARRNAELENPAPEPAAPVSDQWRMGPGGVQSRINAKRGVIEFVQNRNGDVADWTEPYRPEPVNRKSSFAEILISDIGKRTDLIIRHLMAGNIPEAEAEREEVGRFVDENKADLYRFTKYSGRDPLTKKAAEQAMNLVSGSWLTPDQKMLFDPKINPMSARRDAAVLGLSPSAAEVIRSARLGDGGPDAALNMATLQAGGLGALTHSPATKGGGQVSVDGATAPEQPMGDFNTWVAYRDDALSRLRSELPADVLTNSGMAPGMLIGTLRSAFEKKDMLTNYAAIDAGVKAIDGATDLDAPGKVALFHSTVKTHTQILDAVAADDSARVVGAKAMSALQTVLPGGVVANKGLVSSALKDALRYREVSLGAGAPLSDTVTTTVATALAKRTRGSMDLDESETSTLRVLDDVSQMKSGVQVSDDPRFPTIGTQVIQQPRRETSGEAPATPPTPGFVALKNDFDTALDRAAAMSLASGRPVTETLDAASAPVADRFFVEGGRSRPEAELMAKVSLRILHQQRSFDARNINAEIEKYPELVKLAEDSALKVVADARYPGATKKAKEEEQTQFADLVARQPAESYDQLAAMALNDLEVGKAWDMAPGDSEYNQAFDLLLTRGIGPWMRDLTGSRQAYDREGKPVEGKVNPKSSAALGVLFGVSYDKLDTPETRAAATAAFVEQASRKGSSLIFSKVGRQGVEAMAGAFIDRQILLLQRKLGDTKTPTIVGDLLGASAASWDSSALPATSVPTAKEKREFDITEAGSLAFMSEVPGGVEQLMALRAKETGAKQGELSTEQGAFDKMAVYMFLNKALGGENGPGVGPAESQFVKYFGAAGMGAAGKRTAGAGVEMSGRYDAAKAIRREAFSTAGKLRDTYALATLEDVLADESDMLYQAADAARVRKATGELNALLKPVEQAAVDARAGVTSGLAAKKLAPWVKYGGWLMEAASVAAAGSAVVYDLLQKSQVPLDDRDVAVRLKKFALASFELPGNAPAALGPSSVAPSVTFSPEDTFLTGAPKTVGNAIFSDNAVRNMAAAVPERVGALVRPDEVTKLLGAISAGRNAENSMNKQVMSNMAREFMSSKGIEEAYGGSSTLGLGGMYLKRVEREARARWQPGSNWIAYKTDVDTFAESQFKEQRKELQDYAAELKKRQAEDAARIKNSQQNMFSEVGVGP